MWKTQQKRAKEKGKENDLGNEQANERSLQTVQMSYTTTGSSAQFFVVFHL